MRPHGDFACLAHRREGSKGRRVVCLGVWGLAPAGSCAAAWVGHGERWSRARRGGRGDVPPGVVGPAEAPHREGHPAIYKNLCLCPRKNLMPPAALLPRAGRVFNRTPFLKISKRNVYSEAGGLAFAWRSAAAGGAWRMGRNINSEVFAGNRRVTEKRQTARSVAWRGWGKAQKGAEGSRSCSKAGFSGSLQNLRAVAAVRQGEMFVLGDEYLAKPGQMAG